MAGEFGTTASVGFRHVIEDGLALLKEENLPDARRKFVLERLGRLLQEAARGREMIAKEALFVGSSSRSAYESYSLLERYLHSSMWEKRLEASEQAIEELAGGSQVRQEAKRSAIELLEELLASLSREGSAGLPPVPEDLDFSRES